MGLNKDNLIHTEEQINASLCNLNQDKTKKNIIHKYEEDITKKLEDMEKSFDGECTFYQDVCHYIRKIKNPSFLKPANKIRKPVNKIRINENGQKEEDKDAPKDEDIDAPKFYYYAYIHKNSWSNMRHGKSIQKESALKLVIALQLTEDEADALLSKISFTLNPADYRDQIVIAILNAHCFDPVQASMVLEWYSKNGKYRFANIYDI